ncbi:MAG: hypothetical protein GY820_22670 [Gammaproteobacteria bacterium]|nr:hypothetical protein [Gammaproteobacteria bacterium]
MAKKSMSKMVNFSPFSPFRHGKNREKKMVNGNEPPPNFHTSCHLLIFGSA